MDGRARADSCGARSSGGFVDVTAQRERLPNRRAAVGRPMRERRGHIWERATNDHYVEPAWCSERLFDVEEFYGRINDPCCGFGTIPEAAYRAGIGATACDLVDRGYKGGWVEDFFTSTWPRDNIVANPPFNIAERFVRHALEVTGLKVAVIFPTARL